MAGLAIPYSVRFLTDYRMPISGLSAIIAILVSSVVGIIFGTVPATRASQLDPVESLREPVNKIHCDPVLFATAAKSSRFPFWETDGCGYTPPPPFNYWNLELGGKSRVNLWTSIA